VTRILEKRVLQRDRDSSSFQRDPSSPNTPTRLLGVNIAIAWALPPELEPGTEPSSARVALDPVLTSTPRDEHVTVLTAINFSSTRPRPALVRDVVALPAELADFWPTRRATSPLRARGRPLPCSRAPPPSSIQKNGRIARIRERALPSVAEPAALANVRPSRDPLDRPALPRSAPRRSAFERAFDASRARSISER